MTILHGLTISEARLGKFVQEETSRSQKRRRKKPWAKPHMMERWEDDRNIYRTSQGYICSQAVARELRAQAAAWAGPLEPPT